MAKVFLQDVVPNNKRSIRNIPLPGGKIDTPPPIIKDLTYQKKTKKTQTESRVSDPTPENRRRFGSPTLWISILILLLVIGYAVSFLFVSATIKIIPKELSTRIEVDGIATVEPTATGLGYTIITLDKEIGREVNSAGEERVEKNASGKIIIYNSNSSAPQTLIANTRFQTTSGLIFRIKNAVTIPGQKVVDGVALPGSLTTTVYADKPGEEYNVGLSDFTIPGFAGDSKFETILAKSDPSSPIMGGFVGMIKKVSQTDLESAKVAIETQLRSELLDELKSQVPDNYVLFKDAHSFNFKELPQTTDSSGNKAVIKEKGSVYAVLFDREKLSKTLAMSSPEIGQKDIFVSNLDSLEFVLNNKITFNPISATEINFKISGNARFEWKIDQNMVKSELVNKKRAEVRDILKKFESIDRAKVKINPIWIFSLPKNQDKINILVGSAQ